MPRCSLVIRAADRVPDRRSHADYVVRTESIRVADNIVVMHLRADEHGVPEVVAHPSARIDQEMVGAGIASAKVDATRIVCVPVEPGALPSNAAENVCAHLLADIGLVYAIEVEEKRPVGLAAALVVALSATPGGVKSRAQTLMEDHVPTEVYIQAALFRTDEVSVIAVIAATTVARRGDGSKTDHGIALLGGCETGKKQKRNSTREERKLSQRNLLCVSCKAEKDSSEARGVRCKSERQRTS